MPVSSISAVIQQMQAAWASGLPEPTDPAVLQQLSALTQDLIQAYKAAGRLAEDPFFDAWTRPLKLYTEAVQAQVAGKTALVTGGEGCVGQKLIQRLLDLGAERVISIDFVRCYGGGEVLAAPGPTLVGSSPQVQLYAADIRDFSALEKIFQHEQPTLVFHAAAQRLPGLAEQLVHETVTSNITGTRNVIRLCEAFGVTHCVFSSTGKASRYYTGEVYAASKKMAEWLFAQAAGKSPVRYGMVRFTHMLDNSAMREQLEDKVQRSLPVNVHAPDRYVAGQNAGEAVHLLLNALVLSKPQQLNFLLVRNLGWPTESLEVALYNILKSGQPLPIYFQGIQPGYEESFFNGQVNWDESFDINTLINALETEHNCSTSTSEDMIVADMVPFCPETLDQQVEILESICKHAEPAVIRQALGDAVRSIASTSFDLADPVLVLRILRWGINPKQFERGELKLEPYQVFLELLVNALAPRISPGVVQQAGQSVQEFEQLLAVLEHLPSLRPQLSKIRGALERVAVGSAD